MTTQTPTSESNAGDGLMALVAAAVIFIVALEAAFVAFASWLLLPLMLLGVIAAAFIVIFALTRVIDHDTPIPVSVPKPRPVAEKAPAPVRIGATALSGR